MNIRKKILLIIFITFVIFSILAYFLSQFILLDSYRELEQIKVSENLQRILGAVQHNQATLEGQVLDWGMWDATYDFLQGSYEDYIDENFPDESFVNLRVKLITFVNTSGEIVYGKAFDFTHHQELPFPQGIEKHIGVESLIMNLTETKITCTGILILDETPMLISSGPILQTTGEGPVAGTLIMGRYFDDEEIDYLSSLTRTSFTIYGYNDPQLPRAIHETIPSLSKDESMHIQPVGDDSVFGYTVLQDIYGNPALIIKMDMPRTIYQYGLQTINYFFLFIGTSSLIVILVLFVLLEKIIISRLTHLRTSIKNIGKSGNLTMQVTLLGNDELSDLAYETNDLLKQITNSQNKLKEAEQILIQNNQELKMNVEELEKFKEMTIDRELRMVELKKQIKELEEKTKEREIS